MDIWVKSSRRPPVYSTISPTGPPSSCPHPGWAPCPGGAASAGLGWATLGWAGPGRALGLQSMITDNYRHFPLSTHHNLLPTTVSQHLPVSNANLSNAATVTLSGSLSITALSLPFSLSPFLSFSFFFCLNTTHQQQQICKDRKREREITRRSLLPVSSSLYWCVSASPRPLQSPEDAGVGGGAGCEGGKRRDK